MKKLLLGSLVATAFILFGATNVTASEFKSGMLVASSDKCGSGKCGTSKCGGEKKDKCGTSKCGGEKPVTKCGGDKKGASKCGTEESSSKCGGGKCGS